jgi:hypothetical protein
MINRPGNDVFWDERVLNFHGIASVDNRAVPSEPAHHKPVLQPGQELPGRRGDEEE